MVLRSLALIDDTFSKVRYCHLSNKYLIVINASVQETAHLIAQSIVKSDYRGKRSKAEFSDEED